MTRYVVEILSIIVIAAAALYSVLAPAPRTPELDRAIDTKVVIEGTVVREPDVRDKVVQLTVKSEVGTVLARIDKFTPVQYGDRVRVTGTIERPEEFDTDTGRTFNYPMYLRAHGITHLVSFAQAEVLGGGEGNRAIAVLLDIKNWFKHGIELALPEPESSLLAGLLIGEKRGLGDTLSEAFRRAGVIHIIVLSGYNVALVINTVRAGAILVLPRAAALGTSAAVAILFMFMTGAGETAIRATAMALVVLLAKALYRPAEGLRILFLVAAGMAVWNPFLVLFDLSYQLSILATFGLIVFSKPLVPYLTRLKYAWLIEIVSTTIATQIAVLPLLIFSVGQVSVVSIFTNILILLPIPYVMLTGFVAALVALVSPVLALPFTAVSYAILTYIIHISVFMASLPFASVQL